MKTTVILLGIAAVLFFVSFVMLVFAGVNPAIALVWNVMASLDVVFDILPPALVSQNLVLAATLLDAFVFALLAVVLATTFFEIIKQINLQKRFVMAKIRNMKQHIIIVPYNSFAYSLNKELKTLGQKTVLITDNEAEAHRLYRRGELVVVANLKSIETFKIANIATAKYTVACSEDDIENALICMTAKTASPRSRIIARVSDFDDIAKLNRAGAFRLIMPEVTAGNDIGEELIKRVL
jgi:voltage-gated potassium channel